MGVSHSTVLNLRELGHDAIHLRDLGLDRLSDHEILAKAGREDRIVLTFDLDFGDLLATGTVAFPSVIIFRLRDQRPLNVTPRLLGILQSRASELLSGVLIIVEDGRHRIRHLPLDGMEND